MAKKKTTKKSTKTIATGTTKKRKATPKKKTTKKTKKKAVGSSARKSGGKKTAAKKRKPRNEAIRHTCSECRSNNTVLIPKSDLEKLGGGDVLGSVYLAPDILLAIASLIAAAIQATMSVLEYIGAKEAETHILVCRDCGRAIPPDNRK